MAFRFAGKVEFRDTDAAGVVYFANILAFCHAAYEESLAASGILLPHFFGATEIAIPIVRATLDLKSPLFCGDLYFITLNPQQVSEDRFSIFYELVVPAATLQANFAQTEHVCINAVTRQRSPLPESVLQWLQQWSDPIDQ
jgi:1,4-dihydroxy-2-naphthoyl-CoA hydrolase